MTSLLGLYQQDAAAGEPGLMRPVAGGAAWAAAAKACLLSLRNRFVQAEDVSVRQKQIAAQCLDVAILSLDGLAAPHGEAGAPAAETSWFATALVGRQFGIFMALLCGLLLINLWLMSVSGVFSLFALIAVAVLLHERNVGPPRRASGASAEAKPRTIPVHLHVEAVARRIDDIIALAAQRIEAPPEAALKVETLEFFQDILEAVLANDQDYAFKKISRTLEQVLLSEGIEVVTDARNHAAMFAIDTVADSARAGELETVRPALAHASQCVRAGYAQQFVGA